MISMNYGNFEQINYSDEFSLLLYENDSPELYPPHWHQAIEIIMPLENTYNVIIDNESFYLNEEDIMVIPAGTLHELQAPETGRRLIFLVDRALLTNLKGSSTLMPVLQKPRLLSRLSLIDNEIRETARILLLDIRKEYIGGAPLWEMSVYAKLLQFFLLIGRRYFTSNQVFADSTQGKQKEYIEKFDIIFDYIHKNYMKDIHLDNIAQVAGFSKFHFSRLFKQFTNMSFYDYLNRERIHVAENLLINEKLSITEVAFQSGFSSISTFNRVFRTCKKCTPTEFRSLYKIK